MKETSNKRLQLKKSLMETISSLRVELDATKTELAELRETAQISRDAVQKLGLMPSWQHVRRKGARGGGMKLEHEHRVAILEQHANGTPPSAIGRNIISVVKKAAPWLQPVQPTVREIRQMGFELPMLEEALSARRAASAYSVRLIGFDETTDCQEPVLTSNIQIRDVEGGKLDDLVLKAAYLSTKGGTSQAIVSEIEEKCFARLRGHLYLWEKYHRSCYPDTPWTGPDPQMCSLHRLAGGGAIMSDTCNAALKAKRLLADLIRRQAEAAYRQEFGDTAWDGLSDEIRDEKLKVYMLDCQQHLRNIWLGHSSRKQVCANRHARTHSPCTSLTCVLKSYCVMPTPSHVG